MAGRPAAARGGSSGMLYGMIVFAVLAVGGIGAFIWQLTDNQRLRSEAVQAQARAEEFGRPNSYFVDEARARGSSVAAVMQSQIESLANLVVGSKDAVPPAIEQNVNALLARVAEESPGTINPNDTLRTALIGMHRAYQNTRDSLDEAQETLASVQQEKTALAEGFKQAEEDFREQLAQVKEQTEEREETKATELAAKDEQLRGAEQEIESLTEEVGRLRAELTAMTRDHEIEMERITRQMENLRDQLIETRPGGFDPYDILLEADGRIARAVPGSDVVFINLGRQDGIRPGMTFEVYSPAGDADRDRRGKASLEITTVSETTAEARITRQRRGEPIVENDVIVSITYDKNRRTQFAIRGDFDLDYDGQRDWNDKEKVTALIERMGGEVVEDITVKTDFVVVGTGPQVPNLGANRPITDVITNLAETRQSRFEQFEDDLSKARELYIPVITQSQLLFLSGYAGQELTIGA